MTFGLALLLAVIQGLTEFLPVSSKAHLSLMQIFSGSFTEPPVFFDVWLHLATLIAVLVFYRKKLMDYFRPDNFKALIAATFFTGIVGLALKPFAERAFGSLPITGVLLFCTGLYMFITQRLWPAAQTPLDLKRAGLIGLIQGFCVFPGLSRSGWTICTGVNLGLEPRLSLKPGVSQTSFLLFDHAHINLKGIVTAGITHSFQPVKDPSCLVVIVCQVLPYDLVIRFENGSSSLFLLVVRERVAFQILFNCFSMDPLNLGNLTDAITVTTHCNNVHKYLLENHR